MYFSVHTLYLFLSRLGMEILNQEADISTYTFSSISDE